MHQPRIFRRRRARLLFSDLLSPHRARTSARLVACVVLACALLAGCVGTVELPGKGPLGASHTGGGAGATSGASAGTGGSAGPPGSPPSLTEVAARYFPGTAAVNAPKRMVRLSRTQLDLTARALFPSLTLPDAMSALPRDPLQTNYEYADNLTFNPANFTPYTTWVSGIAGAAKTAPEKIIACAGGTSATSCLAEQAKTFVRKAFRGAVPDTRLATYAEFFTSSVATQGLPSATADLVDVTLTSPSFAFRDEVVTDAAGQLAPAQLLQHLTYTLADAPPEALGLSSATAATQLQTPEAASQTVDRILASPAARDKLVRFFLAWLEVKAPDEFTIAASTFPEFTPTVAAAVVSETRAFLARQLAVAAPHMKDLTEATQSIVSGDEAFLYDVSAPKTPGLVALDPAKRLGLFTHPAVLASHSGPTTSRLVKRGVFFVRKVMCLPLGAPPAGIDTTVPANAGATERERIETVTTPSKCAGCHAAINPFGFMQENYDAIGRWRTTDQGAPIDASISVGFLDEGPVMTSSPVEALRAFTRSWRFQQCFARQLFRFYLGRDEAAGDDPVLRQMFLGFAGGEQDIVGMLRTLATAPTFSRRTEVP